MDNYLDDFFLLLAIKNIIENKIRAERNKGGYKMKTIYIIRWNWHEANIDSYAIVASEDRDTIEDAYRVLNKQDQRDKLLELLDLHHAKIPEVARILLEEHPSAGIITAFWVDTLSVI